jgi:predicted metal-dependent HD superfamily phosphohydrolase
MKILSIILPIEKLEEIVSTRTILRLQTIREMYNVVGRYYHNWNHIITMLGNINKILSISDEYTDDLILAIIFHDIIYIPGGRNNEKASAEFYLNSKRFSNIINSNREESIMNAIRLTDYTEFGYGGIILSQRLASMDISMYAALQKLDLFTLFNGDVKTISNDTKNVYREVAHLISPKAFKEKNLYFMENYIFKDRPGGKERLITYKSMLKDLD